MFRVVVPSVSAILIFLVLATACQRPEPETSGEVSPPALSASAAAPFPAPERVLAEGRGGDWLNVDFVAQGDPLLEAQQCVGSRAGAVACFAFPSRADYEAAQPEAAGNFKGELCWIARWQRNGTGEQSGQGERPGGSDCPTPTPTRPVPAAAPPPSVRPVAGPLRVRLDFEVERDASGFARIVGTTNLPDGTALSYSIGDVGKAFLAQDKGTVQAGRFESTWFSFRGARFPAGRYEVGVTVPFRNAQPPEVKAVLGEHLEQMEGPLVEWMEIRELGKVASRERVLSL
jgi:hypothetical protein